MFSPKLCVALLALGGVVVGRHHDLNENEKYLEPYLDDLVDYRESPLGKKYIRLANLVDDGAKFIADLIIPLIVPGSSLTIPVNKEIDAKIPFGPLKLPIKVSFLLHNMTVSGLNSFKHLKPFKLVKGKFSWQTLIEMSKLDISLATTLAVAGKKVDVNVDMPLTNATLDLTTVVAFDRTKLCSVWGDVMKSSLKCALWGLSNYEDDGVSGVNMTSFKMSVDDFGFHFNVSNTDFKDDLEHLMQEAKPSILNTISGSISDEIRSFFNDAFLHGIPKYQREHPCEADPMLSPPSEITNVSRVCISNNAAFLLKWKSLDCPAHFESKEVPEYAMGQTKCMDVSEAYPDVAEGDVLRVEAHAVAGGHKFIEPALRYVPNSNAAAFECKGTTVSYHCPVVSIAPVDPGTIPKVSQVCIMNHGGFLMWYEVQNQRTGSWVDKTGNIITDQKKCIDLGDTTGVTEGDGFKTKVHAIAGGENYVDRDLEYSDNGQTATYECKGTTLSWNCKLVVGMEGDEAASVRVEVV